MPSSGGKTSALDRKSTRLNSSHGSISYAVFCLKQKLISLNSSLVSISQAGLSRDHNAMRGPKGFFFLRRSTGHSFTSLCNELNVFFNETATTKIYTLALHDALPI